MFFSQEKFLHLSQLVTKSFHKSILLNRVNKLRFIQKHKEIRKRIKFKNLHQNPLLMEVISLLLFKIKNPKNLIWWIFPNHQKVKAIKVSLTMKMSTSQIIDTKKLKSKCEGTVMEREGRADANWSRFICYLIMVLLNK